MRLLTPRISEASVCYNGVFTHALCDTPKCGQRYETYERVEMEVDADIHLPRGKEWLQVVTDHKTGQHWMLAGAKCGASDSCFCDAIVICEVSERMKEAMTRTTHPKQEDAS